MQYKWVVLSNTTLGILMASIDINIAFSSEIFSGRGGKIAQPTPRVRIRESERVGFNTQLGEIVLTEEQTCCADSLELWVAFNELD